jgi:hypothetical protein
MVENFLLRTHATASEADFVYRRFNRWCTPAVDQRKK